MRIALVNLPHPVPVVRRYMCSYNSPIFLFPPLELLYIASVAKQWGQDEVVVIDAIAERINKETLHAKLEKFRPDMVITILGFEIFEQDIRTLRWLRQSLPAAKFAAFGHYATVFPTEILDLAGLDFIFRGEPEETFHAVTTALKTGGALDAIPGLTYRSESRAPVSNPDRPRSKHIDELPHPDYSLVNIAHYSEFLLPKPFALVQSARGCPYTCNFCVRSYGQQLGLRSPDNIIEELTQLREKFQIRSFRFIDDTFTAIPSRTIQVCERIKNQLPGVVWSCLARVDTLDEARVQALRTAGCRRVYMGIESGSERILKLYGKDYGVEQIPKMVDLLRRNQIEVGAFFMVGHPEETAEDFEHTSKLVRTLDIDYATVGQTVPYPGTSLFNQYRNDVDFSLFPYRNEWRSSNRRQELMRWEKRFYREMYFKLPYIARHAARLIKHPKVTFTAGKALLSAAWAPERNSLVRNELI